MTFFPYTTLQVGEAPIQIVALLSTIERYRVRLEIASTQKEDHKDFLSKSLLETVSSCAGSFSMEENSRHLLKEGYAKAFRMAYTKSKTTTITKDNLAFLYLMLENNRKINSSKIYRENWISREDQQLAESGAIEAKDIVASNPQEDLVKLLDIYNTYIQNEFVHPLLLIACIYVDFMKLSPFCYDNEVMGLLFLGLMLYKAGYSIGQYKPLEQAYEFYQDEFTSGVTAAFQKGKKGIIDYYPFVSIFLTILYMNYKAYDDTLGELCVGKAAKKEKKEVRIAKCVLESSVPISKKDIAEKLPDVSPTTIEVVLGRLVKEKKVKKIGASKNTKYLVIK